MGYNEQTLSQLGISNLTKLDIPNSYGAYKITNLLFIPPVVSYATNIIGIATTQDGMTITYHYMNNNNPNAEHNFFTPAIENIRQNL